MQRYLQEQLWRVETASKLWNTQSKLFQEIADAEQEISETSRCLSKNASESRAIGELSPEHSYELEDSKNRLIPSNPKSRIPEPLHSLLAKLQALTTVMPGALSE